MTNMPTTSNTGKELIFFDTNAYVALSDQEDSTYHKAHRLMESLKHKNFIPITSSHIVSESLTVVSQKVGKGQALKFFDDLQNSETETIFVDPIIHNQALELFPKIKSKNVSFVDATSFVIMKNRGIKVAFTFDQHFKTQGFKLLGDVI